MVDRSQNRCWTITAMLAMAVAAEYAGGNSDGAPPRPANLPVLKKDAVVVVAGSSVSMNRYGCRPLPEWTGGANRVPPQSYGQNVFFRIFEMLNDHENMCWRRLPDKDWERRGKWEAETKLPYNGPCYGKRISFSATEPDDWAELRLPAGYEKVDLIYRSDPSGDRMRVTIDGKAPPKNAIVDTYQETAIPAGTDLGGDLEEIDSHGDPRTRKRPTRGT